MKPFSIASLFALIACCCSLPADELPVDALQADEREHRPDADLGNPPPGAAYEGRAFQFHKIRDNVYHAVGTGELSVICNSTVIINDSDVMIVDTHVTPAAAWALQRELRAITPNPIRYVINTHYHYDHSHGNQAFGPDVEIIGHEFTRRAMLAGDSNSGLAYDRMSESIPTNIARLREQLDKSTDPARRAGIEKQLGIARNLAAAYATVDPAAPTMTFKNRMTIHRGNREIQLIHFGRGHTGGDVVVYLPNEKLLITGDLLLAQPSYLGNSYPLDWVQTLEQIKSLDFDTILPGHGLAFQDRDRITHIQNYLRDLWRKASAFHRQGVTPEQAATTISMAEHADNFGGRLPRRGVDVHAMIRIYEILDQQQ